MLADHTKFAHSSSRPMFICIKGYRPLRLEMYSMSKVTTEKPLPDSETPRKIKPRICTV